MAGKKFWVVGGEYTNTNFDTIKPETGSVAGPYFRREEAMAEWKRLTEAPHAALVRYTIAEELMVR